MTTHDHKPSSISHITTCNPGKASGDLPRDWSPTQSLGHVNFKHVMHPLTHIWQTVGTVNEHMRNEQSHKTLDNWGNSPMYSKHPNRRALMEESPTVCFHCLSKCPVLCLIFRCSFLLLECRYRRLSSYDSITIRCTI